MVSRLTWAPPHMAVGYQPACLTKQGNYPCYPIMPKFGLTGLGRGPGGGGGAAGARGGAVGARGGSLSPPGGGGPVFVGGGAPDRPRLGGRTFGRGFRFPSGAGPFFSDGSWAGSWNNWMVPWCPDYSYPFYSHPVLRQFGLGQIRPVNPTVPRYGLSDLSTGIFCWPPFASDGSCSWGWSEGIIAVVGAYAIYSIFFTTKTKAKKGYLALEVKAHKRRKSRATKYRERAKALEAKGLGGIFA